MTISYSGNLFKILFRWKGSIWKAVWLELIVFLAAYFLFALMYRLCLNQEQKISFDAVSAMFDDYLEKVPLKFMLAFYITAVIKRWWEQFGFVAWPDDVLTFVCIIIPGDDPEAVKKRRTVARWLVLTAALCWRDISVGVRRRFPTVDHLVWSGLMTDDELAAHNKVVAPTTKWCLPLQWVQKVIHSEATDQYKVSCPPIMGQFLNELNKYRACFRKLYCYDWVCIPLVYTQVTALATYGYFAGCLIGRQYLDSDISGNLTTVTEVLKYYKDHNRQAFDLYFPIFTVVEFFFYIGWFKVGQYLMRPFEEDDDDIELNYMLDRHIQTAFSIVDELTKIDMPASADSFMLEPIPKIPHTKSSMKRQQHPPKLHSTLKFNDKKYTDASQTFLPPAPISPKRNRSIVRQF